MPLSNKLRADYAELINEQLDNIPINSSKDFDAIVIGLSSIIYPKAKEKYVIDKDLQETVANIAEYLDKDNATSIMCYVEERYYPEYLEIIKKRIKKKITEFEKMSKKAKEKYINEQQKRKSQAKKHQAELARHSPPEEGSEAHTITHQQWLANEQARFQEELRVQEELSREHLSNEDRGIFNILDSSNNNRRAILAFIRVLRLDDDNNIIEIAYSFIQDLNERDARKASVFVENPSALAKLINHVTVEQCVSLEFQAFNTLLLKAASFIESKINLRDILSVPSEQQSKFINSIEKVKYLVDNGITLNNLSSIESIYRDYVLDNPEIVVKLISAGVSLKDLSKISLEELKILSYDYFEDNYEDDYSKYDKYIKNVVNLIKVGATLEEVLNLDTLLLEDEHEHQIRGIYRLMKVGVSLTEIVNLKPPIRNELLRYETALVVSGYIKKGALLKDLINLQPDIKKIIINRAYSKYIRKLLKRGITLNELVTIKSETLEKFLKDYDEYSYSIQDTNNTELANKLIIKLSQSFNSNPSLKKKFVESFEECLKYSMSNNKVPAKTMIYSKPMEEKKRIEEKKTKNEKRNIKSRKK